MKAWVDKQVALSHTKSAWVQGWLNRFNVWVPCTAQLSGRRNLKEGNVELEFIPPDPAPRFKLQVPAVAVRCEVGKLPDSIPFTCLPLLRELKTAIKDSNQACDARRKC